MIEGRTLFFLITPGPGAIPPNGAGYESPGSSVIARPDRRAGDARDLR
jgi:hypothetical protein